MRNSIIFVVAFIGLIAFFIYATNLADHDKAESMRAINSVSVFEPSAVNKNVSVKTASDNQQLDDVLPNSAQLKDFEILEEAELLLTSQDAQHVKNGLLVLNIMSERNNARANYILAQLYERGIKVPQDSVKSLSFYKRSALNGFEDANIYLFNHYLDNNDMNNEHLQNALAWFTEASKQANNPIAEYALAHMYAKGLGVPADINQAVAYYQTAANENFALAYEPLGDYYLQFSDDPKKVGDALLLFQRAANEDIPSAQYKLGYMYESALGVKQDYETAKFWYRRAANNQFMKANIALGLLYENGLGADKDNLKAYDYYRIAAEASDPVAQNAVARAFERGMGVDQDLERAIFWYGEAAKQNDPNAEYNLGRIFEEYESVRDLDEAKAWYERAVNSNVSEAKNALNRLAK